MPALPPTFERADAALTAWTARHGVRLLRISLGVVFFWFGFLKLFPGISPAEGLAGETIARISFGLLTPSTAVFILAIWESLMGIGLLFGVFLRAVLLLFLLHMLGTITPLFLFPALCFTRFPFAPTLVGQYIIKNMVLVAAGIVVGSTLGESRATSARKE